MVSLRAARSQALSCAVLLLLSWCVETRAVAQAPKPDTTEDEASDEDATTEGETSLVTQAPSQPQPPPPPVPSPPAFGTSPFTFSFKGTVAISMFAQSVPSLGGNGLAALTAPAPSLGDSWLIGADVRQTRFSLNASGPQLLGASTLASIEMEFGGGNQVTSVGVFPTAAPVTVTSIGGMPMSGTGVVGIPFQSSAQGDESLLPRLRTAYVEFNWDAGTNVLRFGQYHNLLLAMVSASGAHPAVLGYGAGQLGWREPGVTYSHRFTLSDSVKLDVALQLNRNSWNDNASGCTPGTPAAPPMTNCLPYNVSLGEAGLPQVEGRIMLLGPLAPSPWPHYAPTAWQLYVVGHYDQKDLSGIGFNTSMPALRDSMTTYIIEGGGKIKLGPVQIAANGWYGQNAGGVFGHIFQMQGPDKPDVTGFGVWGQAGLSLSQNFSLWFFTGIDQPNKVQAMAAKFNSLQNMQLCGMIAYVDGPLMMSLEYFYIATTTLQTNPMTMVQTEQTLSLSQPSFTVAYSF